MKRVQESLMVNPLYYDVLSGEFNPITDSTKSHSMARLAVATYLKGDIDTSPDAPKQELRIIQYKPTWAKQVTSRLWLKVESDDNHVISGISLEDDEQDVGVEVDVAQPNPEEFRLFITHGGEFQEEYPLELGSQLFELRSRIAQYANYVILRSSASR